MMKLVQLEWMKLKRSNTTKIILLIYAIVVPLVHWLLSLAALGPIKIPDAGYEFPYSYQLVAFWASWLNLMVGVIIIVFVTNEIKFKTQRQNAIDGLRKIDLILSKFIVVVGIALLVSLYTMLVGLVSGLLTGGEYGPLDGIEHAGVYFVSTLGYFIWAFFFASLVRLPALAIVIYIFSTIIEAIIGAVSVQEYVQFFPLRSFANLSRFPNQIFGAAAPENNPYLMTQGESVLLALLYIGLFTAGTYWIIKRRDI